MTTQLTKQEKRLLRKQKKLERRKVKLNGYEPGIGLQIKEILPITATQHKVFESYFQGNNLALYGTAGSGKSFISVYLALEEILQSDIYDKLVIVRSAVPGRDQGFLPGNHKEKAAIYESPYYSICSELFGRSDAYDILKRRNKIEFISTSYNRGITLSNCIILVDEIQNLAAQECDTIITRAGSHSKIIFAGDIRQTDLNGKYDRSGMSDFFKILKKMPSFDVIEFGTEDIVRSKLVKSYIITRNQLEDEGHIKRLMQ